MIRLRAPCLSSDYMQVQQCRASSCMCAPRMQAVWDRILFQHLRRLNDPVLKGKPGSGCGHYIGQILGICDMLVPLLPDQISQANPEITPASPPRQLNALIWLEEHMLCEDEGEGRRKVDWGRCPGSLLGSRNGPMAPGKKWKPREKSGEWPLLSLPKK